MGGYEAIAANHAARAQVPVADSSSLRADACWQVLEIVFGQELPDAAAGFAKQVFAVVVASVGLAAFALVLALIEQVMRQCPTQWSSRLKQLLFLLLAQPYEEDY